MTTPTDQDARAALIKKLLNKAEAKGATDAERDTYNAKATELMVQWSINDAMLAGADATKVEKIVTRRVRLADVPKAYAYEYVSIGVWVADALGCRGFYQHTHDKRVDLLVVGYEADVDSIVQLFHSLALQCTLTLGPWYKAKIREHGPWMSGTDKYQAKRSFIRGFARGAEDKLRKVRKTTVDEAVVSAPGTDLVLVDREKKVTDWIAGNMQLGSSGQRRYHNTGTAAGFAAGQRANVGQGTMGGGRAAIGG
jgi:hypothetical protein